MKGNAMENNARLHALVIGHVQGVGFRAFVYDRAQSLQLTGWVRNTYEGDVEVTAEGPRETLETFLNDLRRGPRSAHVIDVRVQWEQATGQFPKFSILPTSYSSL